jgi:hypothetical protein
VLFLISFYLYRMNCPSHSCWVFIIFYVLC